jgi:hypothetical protein
VDSLEVTAACPVLRDFSRDFSTVHGSFHSPGFAPGVWPGFICPARDSRAVNVHWVPLVTLLLGPGRTWSFIPPCFHGLVPVSRGLTTPHIPHLKVDSVQSPALLAVGLRATNRTCCNGGKVSWCVQNGSHSPSRPIVRVQCG